MQRVALYARAWVEMRGRRGDKGDTGGRPLREGVGRNPDSFLMDVLGYSRPLREGVGRNWRLR